VKDVDPDVIFSSRKVPQDSWNVGSWNRGTSDGPYYTGLGLWYLTAFLKKKHLVGDEAHHQAVALHIHFASRGNLAQFSEQFVCDSRQRTRCESNGTRL